MCDDVVGVEVEHRLHRLAAVDVVDCVELELALVRTRLVVFVFALAALDDAGFVNDRVNLLAFVRGAVSVVWVSL